jgi:hypothetical protein
MALMDPLTLLALATTALAMGRQAQQRVFSKERERRRQHAWSSLLQRADVQSNPELMVSLDRMMEEGLEPPGFVCIEGYYLEMPDMAHVEDPPDHIDVVRYEAEDFDPHDRDTWRGERIRFDMESEPYVRLYILQEEREGWYHETGPEAYGPYASHKEAVSAAWNSELEMGWPFEDRMTFEPSGFFSTKLILHHDDGSTSFGPYPHDMDGRNTRVWSEAAASRLGHHLHAEMSAQRDSKWIR